MTRWFWAASLILVFAARNLAEAESDKTEVSSAEHQLQVEDEVELRLEREAEPKKCGKKCKKRKKNKRKKNRKNRKSRKNKGNDKKSAKSKTKKGRRKSKKVKKQRSQVKVTEREACSFTAATVIAQVKTLIKHQNWQRQARRILSKVEKMGKKADKAATAFSDTLEALNTQTENGTTCGAGGNGNLTAIKSHYDILKNCSLSAKDKCDSSKIPSLNATKVSGCNASLTQWITDFKACATCSCITEKAAMTFDCDLKSLSTTTTTYKDGCTGNSQAGSFGDCSAKQKEILHLASGCDTRCGSTGPSSGSTSGSRMRRLRFQQALANKLRKKQKTL